MRPTTRAIRGISGRRYIPARTTAASSISMTTTDAAMADINQLPSLLHRAETTLYGDRAYYKTEDQQKWELSGGPHQVSKKGKRKPETDEINRSHAWVRAVVEHPFHVMKRLWGFTKVRYRGLAKNTIRAFALDALTNLYRLWHRSLFAGR